MLERITYVSRAAAGLRREDVHDIIRASRSANKLAGVSGCLVFLDGWFAQVIEGNHGAVDALYARIARDTRHVELVLRCRERVLCRLFPDQEMALRDRNTIDAALLREFAYAAGFPVETFPADVLVEFTVQACRRAPEQELRAVS